MRSLVIALATGTMLVAGAPAFAQTQTATPTIQTMAVPQDAVLSYNLVGLNVTDAQNNTVGEIKDLVIERGALAGYILSVGGFLGMGEHYVAVAPASVGLTWDAGANKWKAIVNASKDQLKAAPEFKYDGKFKK